MFLSPASQTHASDPPFRSVADRPPTPFATRPSRQRSTRSPLPPLQRVQTFVFTPFLEETYSRLFRREIYVYPDELKYGVKEMKNRRRRTEYIHIRKGSGSHRQERIRRQFVGVWTSESDVSYNTHSMSTTLLIMHVLAGGSPSRKVILTV